MLVKINCTDCETRTICLDDLFEIECTGCGAILCVQDGEPCDIYDTFNGDEDDEE